MGINPVSGGRPPSERRIRGVRDVRAGVLVHEMASVAMFVALFSLKTRNVEVVIRRYVIRVRSVMVGENWRMSIIQPR